jgi:hypothetical protein
MINKISKLKPPEAVQSRMGVGGSVDRKPRKLVKHAGPIPEFAKDNLKNWKIMKFWNKKL